NGAFAAAYEHDGGLRWAKVFGPGAVSFEAIGELGPDVYLGGTLAGSLDPPYGNLDAGLGQAGLMVTLNSGTSALNGASVLSASKTTDKAEVVAYVVAGTSPMQAIGS